MDERKRIPTKLGEALSSYLTGSGLNDRIEQAGVIPNWPDAVGPQIAAIAEPQSVSREGTLVVSVRTHSWMNELSLREPEIISAINGRAGKTMVRRIRWQLLRG